MADFEWTTALSKPSDRRGESRWVAIGYIRDHIHYLVYTQRQGRLRVISLRRANSLERREYEYHN